MIDEVLITVKLVNDLEAWRYVIFLVAVACYVAIWRMPEIIRALKERRD